MCYPVFVKNSSECSHEYKVNKILKSLFQYHLANSADRKDVVPSRQVLIASIKCTVNASSVSQTNSQASEHCKYTNAIRGNPILIVIRTIIA